AGLDDEPAAAGAGRARRRVAGAAARPRLGGRAAVLAALAGKLAGGGSLDRRGPGGRPHPGAAALGAARRWSRPRTACIDVATSRGANPVRRSAANAYQEDKQ